MKKVARMLRRHRPLILNWFRARSALLFKPSTVAAETCGAPRVEEHAGPVRRAIRPGRLEVLSQQLADHVRNCGRIEIRPIPTYHRPVEGYEDTFKDWPNKVKGAYPLQQYSVHVLRRAHSTFENVPWLREAFPHELFMNPVDAAPRGIQHGDWALIESRHGKVLRPVWVTELIIPGVVALGQGAWVELDEETGIDLAGCTNVLNGAIPTGQGQSGWNSCNVQVTKWTGKVPEPDYRWAPRVPIKEGAA